MAFADIFKRSRKPLDEAEGEGVSPVGGELAGNEAVRRKQRMLLAGVAGVGLVVSSMWIFSGDDGKKVADTDGAEKVEVSTKDMVTLNFRAWMNWFLQATGIYLCLMVPTIDIKVTDRINPSLAPATVANVPLGLGVLASFTTQIGDWLTRTAETVFVMPGELITRWMREKQDGIREEIAGRLQEPDLVQVHRPGVDSAADVSGSYRPHGVSGIPAGPGDGNRGAAQAVIERGGEQLEGDRAAARAARTGAVQGSVDVQSEVNRDHNRGFFVDPKLRE